MQSRTHSSERLLMGTSRFLTGCNCYRWVASAAAKGPGLRLSKLLHPMPMPLVPL